MIAEDNRQQCPCGSGDTYGDCCQRCHQGEPAPTPEKLMRSRFSAFVKKLPDYVKATWHSRTRPQTVDLEDSPPWTSLQVLSSTESGNGGSVHFRAIYRVGNGWGYLEEDSTFLREDGRWYYLSGDPREGVLKPGRNEPCPCGSGRKHKACCL